LHFAVFSLQCHASLALGTYQVRAFFRLSTIEVLRQFTRREIRLKYQGTLLGAGWVLVLPLLLLGMFTFVFNGVFQMRWPNQPEDSAVHFALFMFAGLLLHQTLAEVLSRAPGVFVGHSNLVTKVVFPLWVLPFSMTLGALYHILLSLLVYLVLLFGLGFFQWSWLALPLLLVPFVVLCCSLALLLATLGVFLRDLGPVINLLVMALMFLTPIFYPLSSVSGDMAFWLGFNPMAILVESLREMLFAGLWPDRGDLMYLWVSALGNSGVALWIYRRLKGGFADVL
jgi:lipopolysaccharide transport system permease protein